MIKIEGVGYSYPDAPDVLCNLDLEVPDGSFIAIIGPNGSGKSTLAKLLNNLITPCSGCISADGIVGMVFQNPENQIIGDTVEDDVAFGPENLGLPTEEIRQRVDGAVLLTGLEGLKNRNPLTLSGGQMQRLAIAGVLALKPECIVLDESLSMLDRESKEDVLQVLRRLNREEGLSIILITHDIRDCADAECIYELEEGKLRRKC